MTESPGELTEKPEEIKSEATQANSEPPADPRQGLPPTVHVETGPPLQLQPEDPNAKGPWVVYTGVGTVRYMTPKDWADQGVDSQKHCEWSSMNHKRLPRSIFTDAELQYLLRKDGRFKLVD